MDAKDFVDYAGFCISLNALDEVIEAVSAGAGDPTKVPADLVGLDLPTLQAHQAKGMVLLKAIAVGMDEGINVLLRQMTEKANLRVKTKIDAALTGNPVSGYQKRAKLLVEVFGRLSTRLNAVREVLEDADMAAAKVLRAANQSTPQGRLLAIANVVSASGSNTRLKKWGHTATELCGNAVSDDVAIANDVTEVNTLVKQGQITDLKIQARDPGDAEMPALADAKAKNDELLKKSVETAKNPQIAQTAVVTAKQEAQKSSNVTLVGQRIEGNLTAPQEECVMARGKLVFAAGAGSGKTRVLAAKVVYHIQEQRIPPSGVMAVSFSRKSAAELKARVIKFAGEAQMAVAGDELRALGTTHSIARMVLNQSGRFSVSGSPKAPDKEKPIIGEIANKLLRAAIAQVKMSSVRAAPMPSDALSFFPNLGKANFQELEALVKVKSPVVLPVTEAPVLGYYLEDPSRFAKFMGVVRSALNNAANSLSVSGRNAKTKFGPKLVMAVSGPGLEGFGNAISRFRFMGQLPQFKLADSNWNRPNEYIWWTPSDTDGKKFKAALFAAIGMDAVLNAQQAVQTMGNDPTKLTAAQQSILQAIVTQPVVSSALTANSVPVKTAASKKKVSLDDYDSSKADREKDNQTTEFHYYLNNPANQWFNIGASDEDFMVDDGLGKGGKKKVPPSAFRRFIGLNKNNLKAPGVLFLDADKPQPDGEEGSDGGVSPKIMSAVYGAYEWLKSNHPVTKGRLDYDDQLIQAVRVLTEDPKLLAKLQMQYKCLLVDEAQDLNVVQHNLFGLIAGATDPRTLAPRKDGKMSADTFAFIGDDKQAIYEFRGANPDHFIEKSDMGPVKGDYKTLMLDKNFRSGSAIVDAANKLIKYNTKQIPMVCTTDPKKGEGSILREQIGFEEEGPSVMVNKIMSDLDAIKGNDGVVPDKFWKNYGLAARTNREILAYQMALIGAGIPFRSKRNPFNSPALKPLVAVCRMFLPNAKVEVRNRGFLDGLKMPDIGVSPKTVEDQMRAAGAGDLYKFGRDGGYEKVYANNSFNKKRIEALKNYCTKYLPDLEALISKGTSREFLDMVTSTTGADGQNFIDQLALSIRDSEEEMEEAQALADQDDGDGVITDDILRQQAAKPLEPLFSLAKRYSKPADFIGYLDSLAMRSLQTVKLDDEAQADDNLVTLDTVHGWKGLECKHLFVPMAEGRFPIVRPDSPNPERAMESERRLAYVALTRGEQSVTIIEPTMRMKGDKVVKLNPSQFVTEACIQVKGKVPTAAPPARTASVEDALKTGDVTPFLMPVLEDEDSGSWGESMYEQDPMPEHLELEDDLEAQWGDYLLGSEEN